MEGNSSNAAKLISHSRRKISTTNYESAWGQWTGWCNERQVNPFQAPVNYMINYLSEKFDKGLQNRTLNCLKSAISAYHVHIDGKSVRKHPKVSALLAGIFNQRPPQPRYVFIWDVVIVLQYIRTHWYENSSLNDTDLTCKLTTLLALTTASRASMIQHLNTEFMVKDKDRYIFYFSKLHKSWRKGQVPPTITYFSFGEDKALHVVETLNEYINRSKPWRESNHEKQLLLSSIRPHNAVVSCTISGWLKKTLKQAGINTDLFKAYSTRPVLSSKASVGECL